MSDSTTMSDSITDTTNYSTDDTIIINSTDDTITTGVSNITTDITDIGVNINRPDPRTST